MGMRFLGASLKVSDSVVFTCAFVLVIFDTRGGAIEGLRRISVIDVTFL